MKVCFQHSYQSWDICKFCYRKKKDPEHLHNNFTSQKGLVSTKELTLPKSCTYGWITKLNQYLLSFSSCVCPYCKSWNRSVKNDKLWCYLFESPTLLDFHNWFESLSAKNSNFLNKFWNISWIPQAHMLANLYRLAFIFNTSFNTPPKNLRNYAKSLHLHL